MIGRTGRGRRLACAGLLLALTAGLTACGGGDSGEKQAAESDQAAAGGGGNVQAESIYKANCMGCHGAELAGASGPNLQKVGSRLSQEQIAAKITNGGGGMPTYKGRLKDNEIGALAEWLAAKK